MTINEYQISEFPGYLPELDSDSEVIRRATAARDAELLANPYTPGTDNHELWDAVRHGIDEAREKRQIRQAQKRKNPRDKTSQMAALNYEMKKGNIRAAPLKWSGKTGAYRWK